MIVTCPACGRKAAVAEEARDVVCDCGRRFDPSARPTVADPFLGKDLEGYRIEELVGSGAMGTVYRATQLSLGRPVAVKVLPPNVSDDPHFVHRFHREAEILAALAHPHVVQVIDRGAAEGRYFIVMEYVDGESLRSLLKRGPVPPRDACRICSQLLDALDYAHRKGVVHRDIKPENILLSREGNVKVADFGVSRFLEADPGTRLTRTHFVLGTYEYMAPEQRESVQEADNRSDIYATAVVLYEMLTGELPIGRFDLPSRKLPDVDRRLDAILKKGLAKDPARRYERASAMARELGEIVSSPDPVRGLDALREAVTRLGERLRGPGEPAAPPRPPKSYDFRLDLLLTVLGVLGVLLAVVGIGFLIAGERIEIGLYRLDDDSGGLIVAIFGIVLWRAAERARRFGTGSRTMLLALTALLAPTFLGLPFAFWTWWALAGSDLRAYFEARAKGLGTVEAAARAQNLPHPDPDPQHEALRCASLANRKAARVLALLSFLSYVFWILVALDAPRRAFRDEGFAFFLGTWIFAAVAVGFRMLARQVQQRAWLHPNAWTWTILSPLAPKTAARARLLAQKDL
ncbi:MAG TPA: serine/threonine-protein kinase [Planctomycetota bacterium]|nr:serine/threonine-protein kinase [Planctomycetota bacterium]